MGLAHTSVPRWPTSDPGVDLSGRSYAVLSFGSAAAEVTGGWCRRLVEAEKQLWSYSGLQFNDAARTELQRQLAGAAVGWRLMLAGPESDLLTARAEAGRGGTLDAEITAVVTGAAQRSVWCSHCGAVTTAAVEVDGCTGCGGCGRPLQVHHHVNRLSGTYLGFQADAEEV